jgi:hypothetical protein
MTTFKKSIMGANAGARPNNVPRYGDLEQVAQSVRSQERPGGLYALAAR